MATSSAPLAKLTEVAAPSPPKVEVDELDLALLRALVRLRVRDHAHLRELLLTKIFQINGVQRTETFLSLADVEPDNFSAAMLEVMSKRKAKQRT